MPHEQISGQLIFLGVYISTMLYQAEAIKDVLDEAIPLLEKHWMEVAHFKDIPLEPNYERYHALENLNLAKLYTARTEDGKLVGYAVFFVMPHIHYQSMQLAQCDIVFIEKKNRGYGSAFFQFCDDCLQKDGVNVVAHHVKSKHNFSFMLERSGYELMDLIYVKRLN